MSINAQTGRRTFVGTILAPITQCARIVKAHKAHKNIEDATYEILC